MRKRIIFGFFFVLAAVSVFSQTSVVNIYQDANQNGELDNRLFNIPKEPVGISNWNGSGVPDSFEKLKLTVDNMTHIIRVNLFLM